MISQINVKGIRCYAYHGCLPEERIISAEYVVDVIITNPKSEINQYDRLIDTVDYSDVYKLVVEEMKIPSNLIEHVTGRIFNKMKEIAGENLVSVSVTKINPPVNGDLKEVTFTLSDE
jgi:7,8-dihydroneopterin aldolase/epimerase/oxygenase